MEARVIVRLESDPEDGDVLEHVLEVPDQTDIESLIDLAQGVSAMAQDVDRSVAHTPVFTVYVSDAEFASLSTLWKVAA